MTETDARDACAAVEPKALPALDAYVAMVIDASATQNLVAASSIEHIWSRHIWDSLQLADYAPKAARSWLDVGSGAGLPGLVLATLGRWEITLCEPRTLRATFLSDVVARLGLDQVSVVAGAVEKLVGRFDVISARAVAPAGKVFAMTRGCATRATRYILPKGRSAEQDIERARAAWQGVFHVEQSRSDPEAGIIVADRLEPK